MEFKFIAAKKKKKSSNHTNYHPPWHFLGPSTQSHEKLNNLLANYVIHY